MIIALEMKLGCSSVSIISIRAVLINGLMKIILVQFARKNRMTSDDWLKK